ncbi:MAG: 50S ribosomal protein L19e [Nitrososphaerales archaeon]
MNLTSKKEMAAQILKVGVNKIRLDPENLDRIEDAITKDNIRQLIREGIIWAERKRGISRGRFREHRKSKRARGRGEGSKKGAKGARMGKKKLWVHKVRALRRHIKILRDRGEITNREAKELRIKVKGGQIRNLKHLREIVQQIKRW